MTLTTDTTNPAGAGAEPEPASAARDALSPPMGWVAFWVLLLSASAIGGSFVQIAAGLADRGVTLLLFAVLVCAAAAWYDAATARVPNALTYTAAMIGLAANLLAAAADAAGFDLLMRWTGSPGAAEALVGLGACLLIGVLCMFAAQMGGGDAKLLVAVGATLGFDAAAPVMFNALAIAAVFALVNLVWEGQLTAALQYLAYALMTLVYARTHLPEPTRRRRHVPLAVAVLLGLLTAQVAPFYDLIVPLLGASP